jgi:hypothetical protein
MKPIIKTIQSFSWLLWITWDCDNRRKTPLKKWLKRVWRMSKYINEWDEYKWLDKILTRQRKETLMQKKINILNKE